MNKFFKLALALTSMISLFSCSKKVNNVEYNDYNVDYIRSNYKVICGNRNEDEIVKLFESI